MKIDDFHFPEELYYDEFHQWVNAKDDVVSIGVTDYAQNVAGDIVFVELPQPGAVVQKGQSFGSIESGKWVGRLYASVGGTVVEVNEALAKDPRAVNRDPYGQGWVAQIKVGDLGELRQLMRVEAAREYVEAELERERLTGAVSGEGDGES